MGVEFYLREDQIGDFGRCWHGGMARAEMRERFKISDAGLTTCCKLLDLGPRRIKVEDSRGWPAELEAELTRLWHLTDEAGQPLHSGAEIGRMLGLGKNAVVGKAHRLGLEPRPSPIIRDGRPRRNRESRTERLRNADNQAAIEILSRDQNRKPGEPLPCNGADLDVVGRKAAQKNGGQAGCQYPLGDPGTPDFSHCGAETLPGKSYCAEHHARCYLSGSKAKLQAADWDAKAGRPDRANNEDLDGDARL